MLPSKEFVSPVDSRRCALRLLAGTPLAMAMAGAARAQDDKTTISILVGASSSMDYTARLLADHFRDTWSRPVIALSRLGAGQRVALGEARRAAPDGRTLVFATTGPFSVYPNIYKRLDYDPDADFTPIAGVSTFDVAIATGPLTGATTLQELVTWARAQPTETVYASAPGNGSLSHFCGIAIGLATGLKLTHVPYKDSGGAALDVAAARLPILITGFNAMLEMHRAGRIRILAVSGDKRSPLAPEIPTLREAGVDVTSSTYTGLFGPAKMPAELVARIHDTMQPLLANPQVREKLALQAMVMWPVNGQQLAKLIVDERQRFAQLVKASGYVPEAA